MCVDAAIKQVDGVPVNPNATKEAKALMAYLSKSYGKVVLSGQYAEGIHAPEIRAIYNQTGKYPAMMGFDYLYYGLTPSRNMEKAIETTTHAIDWWNKGGIVTFCWHWMAPKDNYLRDDCPWDKTFYTRATAFNMDKALNGQDPQGYDMLLADIDTIAEQLKILDTAGIPVLWRPLHEASGGWFWWGAQGAKAYKQLWHLLYHRLVNHHNLNNLLWVWNGQHNGKDALDAWYPGDETVDIIGEDIYAEKHDYSSQVQRFKQALKYTNVNKIITLSETGVLPDPDELFKDSSVWSWFAPWYREFVVDMNYPPEDAFYSDEYTEVNMLRKVYLHDKVVTLDTLPLLNKKAIKPIT